MRNVSIKPDKLCFQSVRPFIAHILHPSSSGCCDSVVLQTNPLWVNFKTFLCWLRFDFDCLLIWATLINMKNLPLKINIHQNYSVVKCNFCDFSLCSSGLLCLAIKVTFIITQFVIFPASKQGEFENLCFECESCGCLRCWRKYRGRDVRINIRTVATKRKKQHKTLLKLVIV